MGKLLAPLLLLAAAIALAVLLDRPGPRAEVVVINRGDASTLDIHRMSWLQDLRLAGGLWEGLVRPDVFSPGFEPQPAVAERWEISGDRRTYTFHLRPGAKWSNGEPLTSRDFKRTWLRAILPDTGGDYLNLFGLIKGVREFAAWRSEALRRFSAEPSGEPLAAAQRLWDETLQQYEQLVAVSTPDDRTLIIQLERPTPYFLDVLGYEITFPLYMALVEQYQQLDARTARMVPQHGWTRPDRLVSNGPFILKEWRFKRELRFERNPHYWDRENVLVESISFPTVEDPGAAVIAARTGGAGGADWLTDVAADCRRDLITDKAAYLREHKSEYDRLAAQGLTELEILRRLAPDPRANVHVFPSFGTYFLNLNCSPTLPDGRPNPLADARVRRALALAVDKRAITDIRGIGEPPTGSLTPPGSIANYSPPRGLPHDPVQARALLSEAGFAGGKGLPVIEILFNKDAGHDLVAQSIAKDWQGELGISVALRQKERKVFREDLKNRNYLVATANWFGDYGDPTTFLDINRTGDGNNDRGFADPHYDALLDQARDQPDPAARLRILEEAERYLMDAAPLVPLVHEGTVTIFDPHKLDGVSPHPRQKQLLGMLKRLDRPE